MNLETHQDLEYMKRELNSLEKEESQLKAQLERITAQKNELLKRISEKSDEDYEQEVLTRLYEQRRDR